jgi:IS30 family transposase
MEKTYSHLTSEERCEIYRLHAGGISQNEIARRIGRDKGTISRELRRNIATRDGAYNPIRAQNLAHARAWRGGRLERFPALREAVFDRLIMGWSPETIAATLKHSDGTKALSYESVYRYAHSKAGRKDKLYKLLPRGKASRGWRVAKDPATRIPGRVSIHDRPESVNNRAEIGHWEADLMCFADQKQALLVLTERKTRLVMAARLANKQAKTVEKEAQKLMQGLPRQAKRTITFDNGGEFARHKNLANALNINTYFCDAHAPWQKGSVENQIGRLRSDLPRKIPLKTYCDGDINDIILNHNDMPRKCLGWRTPFEAFITNLTQTVALQM